MADFDFINSTSNLTFEFGYTGEFSDFNFAEVSEEGITYDFEFDADFVQSVFIYNILLNNNTLTSVWADPTASLNNGKFYIGNKESLTIINHNSSQAFIEDYFSKTIKGSTNETLNSEDVVDINVAY